ncbi:MAG: hypothetical protein IKI94_01515, partial [Ruminococcus sp.]|nr:hypothetical protein [Ruminococcus sp.]
ENVKSDGGFDIPESYDGAYNFTLISIGDSDINPVIAEEGDLVVYFALKVKDTTPDGVYEFIFDTSRTKGINMESMYSGGSVPLVLNNGTITIDREKQTTTATTTTTKKPVTTTTITTTKKPATTTTTTTTKKPVTTTTVTTKKPVTTTTVTTTKKPVTTTTATTTKKPATTTTITTTKKSATTTTTTTTKKPVTTTTATTTKKPATTTTVTTTKKPATATTVTTTKKPATTTTTTTAKKPATTTTVVTATTGKLEPTLKGDANGDSSVDIADVVSAKCYLINGVRYSLSKQGLVNADVHNSGNGLNVQDVLAIQKKALKLISDFDAM